MEDEQLFLHTIQRECSILKGLRHPNVIKLIEIIDDPKNDKIYIITEYVQNGPCWKKGISCLSENTIRSYMKDIINGLDYCKKEFEILLFIISILKNNNNNNNNVIVVVVDYSTSKEYYS